MKSASGTRTAADLPADQQPELRLFLTSERPDASAPAGAWWPHSNDPLRELAALVSALSAHLGAVTDVALDLAAWDRAPRRLDVEGRTVRLTWRMGARTDAVTLTSSGGRPITLL